MMITVTCDACKSSKIEVSTVQDIEKEKNKALWMSINTIINVSFCKPCVSIHQTIQNAILKVPKIHFAQIPLPDSRVVEEDGSTVSIRAVSMTRCRFYGSIVENGRKKGEICTYSLPTNMKGTLQTLSAHERTTHKDTYNAIPAHHRGVGMRVYRKVVKEIP